MMSARSLRFHMVALFYLGGVLLAASYLAFYIRLSREIHAQLDRQLIEGSNPVVAELISDFDIADLSELKSASLELCMGMPWLPPASSRWLAVGRSRPFE